MVQKLNPLLPILPTIVDEVMSYNADTKVACHSTLFKDYRSIFSVPDEMEYAICSSVLCENGMYCVLKSCLVAIEMLQLGQLSMQCVVNEPYVGPFQANLPAYLTEVMHSIHHFE